MDTPETEQTADSLLELSPEEFGAKVLKLVPPDQPPTPEPAPTDQSQPSPSTEPAPAAATTEPAPATEEPAPTEEAAPEEPKPEEKKPEEKPPLTKFQLYDAEGHELEIPDIRFSYKANGKLKENVPLDKLVLLAQMGEYNTQREEEVISFKKFAPQILEENKGLKGYVQQVDEMVARMFEDENYYNAAKEDYQRNNSPESRAARAEQEARSMREAQAQQQQEQYAINWINQNVVPVYMAVKESTPLVNEYEMMGYYNQLIAPFLDKGRIPSHRLEHVKSIVEVDLANWARGLQMQREEGQKQQSRKLEAAKTQVVQQKRQIARAISGPAGGPPIQPKPQPPQTAEEWIERTFSRQG